MCSGGDHLTLFILAVTDAFPQNSVPEHISCIKFTRKSTFVNLMPGAIDRLTLVIPARTNSQTYSK
jgi:hypothetical protein